MVDIVEIARRAKQVSRKVALTSTAVRNQAIHAMADCIWKQREAIIAANQLDVQDAKEAGLPAAMVDRLLLTEARIQGIVNDLRSVASLPDPVGEIFEQDVLPNGLRIRKQRVPLGVLGVIYEARPNVTVDVAGLALKSGNCAILRGGKETIRSNCELAAAIQSALVECGLPQEAVQFIDAPDRELVLELLQQDAYIDMIIPRGGAGLHEFCRKNSRIPVITGGIGICHLYVDESANLEAALPVIENAKIQRPTVCNALDTVLVHREAAANLLPALVDRLTPLGVTFRAEPKAMAFVTGKNGVLAAGEKDFDTEWLSLVLGLKVVDGLEEAVEHITAHSTAHSDGILTADAENARRFVEVVDSAAVYVNASTRFTDGSQMGLGAEVAISTQRLHARGPMGLRELTTFKWIVEGDYHVRK